MLPQDSALRFLALLMEDYGDEWLWRPWMWWTPGGNRGAWKYSSTDSTNNSNFTGQQPMH
jgi:hypothetical protein